MTEASVIGFLFPTPDRTVDDIAVTVAGDLRRLFVGFPASGEWRLVWSRCVAGVELLIVLDGDLLTDSAHQQLTDIVLSGRDPVRVLVSHEIHDLLARLRDARADGATRRLGR